MKRLLLTLVMMVTVVFAANAQQSQYYDYIKNIQPSVDKYYPQYSAYFKNVLAKFNSYGTAEKYLINKWINITLKNYESISSDKGKVATVLLVFDYLEGESKFIKDTTITHKQSDGSEDRKVKASNSILKGIKWEYDAVLKTWDEFDNNLKEISESIDNNGAEKSTSALIELLENQFKRFKEYYLDAGIIQERQALQNMVHRYEEMLKRLGRQPSEIGKLYIQEYNKIKNKK